MLSRYLCMIISDFYLCPEVFISLWEAQLFATSSALFQSGISTSAQD
jgi:hypothetical protein